MVKETFSFSITIWSKFVFSKLNFTLILGLFNLLKFLYGSSCPHKETATSAHPDNKISRRFLRFIDDNKAFVSVNRLSFMIVINITTSIVRIRYDIKSLQEIRLSDRTSDTTIPHAETLKRPLLHTRHYKFYQREECITSIEPFNK